MRTQRVLVAAILTGLQLLAASACAASRNPCDVVFDGNRIVGLKIVANGFTGWLGGVTGAGLPVQQQGLKIEPQPDGTYKFSGQALFDGEAATQVSGTCKDRHMQFIRAGNGWTQSYTGYIHEKLGADAQEMSGLFGPLVLVNRRPKANLAYGWCAKAVVVVIPY